MLMYLLDLHPLTVGAWSMSSLALKFSSWLDELTTVNPIFLDIPVKAAAKTNNICHLTDIKMNIIIDSNIRMYNAILNHIDFKNLFEPLFILL